MTDIRVKDLVLELAQYLAEHPEDEAREDAAPVRPDWRSVYRENELEYLPGEDAADG